MIQIKEIADKSTWEKFNLTSANPTFLQSWAWGDFQNSLGRDVYRLGIYKDKNLVGISLLGEEKAKIASFLYCPGGLVLTNWSREFLNPWLSYVGEIAKEKNIVFLRIDPRILKDSDRALLKNLGFVAAPEYTQPQCTATIDLTKSEEELRHNLSDSTRYNINAGERKGVKVREGRQDEIGIFLNLLKETAERKTLILPKEASYHANQFDRLAKEGLMRLFIAETGSQALSATLLVSYAGTVYYLHAANSLQQKDLRASYSLVWNIILEAKKAGNKRFDFWGIAPSADPKHSWAGVTNFKLSFGAERVCYDTPFDLPYKTSYQISKLVEIWRKPLRKILRFGG
ncbi:MAG TPA: peptidoglycan bridge formation glycyltransferase FemA/FemB family protein [Candidatus Nanoarchaeia archaeon]